MEVRGEDEIKLIEKLDWNYKPFEIRKFIESMEKSW